jgi:hypothetical protein
MRDQGPDMLSTDEHAKEKVIRSFGLPACAHIPIAAKSEAAITKYIGRITAVLVPGEPNQALLVEIDEPPKLNLKMPIWRMPQAAILHTKKQVWVHVDYHGYRECFRKALPAPMTPDVILDHVLNRRMARLMGFPYLRIVPISRGANSSSGGLCEKWGVEYHGTPRMVEINKAIPAQIQYADIADIVKMLDMKTGGSLQDPVNEAQALLEEQ